MAKLPSYNPLIEGDVKVKPSKPKLQPPPMYKIVLYNDDFTPMEFVVYVLIKFFNLVEEVAHFLMLTVHTQGSAVIGIYPREIAETLSLQLNEFARENNYPLLSAVEKDD